MKRALQAQGIATPVIDASQLNHTLLNGSLKSLAEATQQQNQETIQATVHQHHLLHTKQEPGTANNSPKVRYSLYLEPIFVKFFGRIKTGVIFDDLQQQVACARI